MRTGTEDPVDRFQVVVNHEEQYSIWPEGLQVPDGWEVVGDAGPRAECLDYIDEVWTDLRPASLRRERDAEPAAAAGAEPDGFADLATRAARLAGDAPEATAVEHGGVRWSRRDIDSRANRIARLLREVRTGDEGRVALLLPRSADCVAGLLAVHRTGSAAVMIDPDGPEDHLRGVLADAKVDAILTCEATARRLGERPEAVVRLDRAGADLESRSAEPIGEPASPDDTALVFYTSGSTGEPKGVLIRHRAIANIVDWTASAYRVTSDDRASWLSSPGFAIAAQEWIAFLGLGATLCVGGAEAVRSPESVRDWLLDHRVSHSVLVAPLAERLWPLEWPDDAPLRFMFPTGAPVRRWAPADLPFEVVGCYATTETLVTTSCYNAATGLRITSKAVGEADRTGPPLPVGPAIDNVRVYVCDEDGRPVPEGETGELYVAGAGVAAGYLGRPELTAEKFIAGRPPSATAEVLYRTGDLARLRPDGGIELVGRADDQVKIRGYRVETAAVENALEAVAWVAEAAVTAEADGVGETRLVAHVVPAAEGAEPAARLKAELAERLPDYMVPAAIRYKPELPRLASGKLDRRALAAERGDSRSGLDEPYTAPRDEWEARVVALWRELLHVPLVGVDDDFMALGGHSLLAVDFAARLRTEHGVRIGLDELYRLGTPARIAAVLSRRRTESETDAVTAPPEPEARYEPFPLTDTQYAYWIGRTDAVELGGVGCHGYFEWQSRDLDVQRLQRAWNRLVERHDALRLRVLPDGAQQVLEHPPEYRIAVLDLSGSEASAADRELGELRERLAHQVFAADRWPLFDVRATLLPDGLTRLHLSFDLLITDAWSYVQILIPELVQLYEDPEARLEPLEATFRDYVREARAAEARSPEYAASERYWLERLDTLPAAPDLPQRQRGADEPIRFHRRADRLDRRAWELLRERAAAHQVTPACMLIAAFAEVLRTWSADERFTINCPLFNRRPVHPRINQVVGDFTTTSLLAIDRPDGTFADRARAVQRQMWADLEHRHYSGVRVMRELAKRDGRGVRAAFPVVVTSMLGQPPRRFATAFGEPVFGISQTPQVSLDFQLWEEPEALAYNWDSIDAMFPPGMLDDMFAAFRGLLRTLIEDASSWSRERFELVPAAQLEARAEANDTDGPVPDALLHSAVAEHARLRPDAPAVITAHETLGYAELSRRVNRVGNRLRELGAEPNRLIAVVMDKGWEQLVAVHGVLASGAAYLPIDPKAPAERLRSLLEHGQVDLVLTQQQVDERLCWPEEVRRLRVELDFEDASAAPLEPAQRPTDLAYVIHTSGSTGAPKGVAVDHRGACNTIDDFNRRFGVGPDDRAIAVSDLHFDLSVYDAFGIIAAGGAVAVPDPAGGLDPEGWIRLAAQAEVTCWNSVPALLEAVVEHAEGAGGGALPPSLRLAILAGDWIPVDLPGRVWELHDGVQVVASGGPAETCVWSIINPLERVDPAWTSIPYGRPMTNQRYHVLDGRLRHRPDWVPGEMYIASDVGLARGYWRDEELTAERFVTLPDTGERAYASGDVGRYLPDGSIEILGRTDFQVKIQGVRIEPAEIETCARLHPDVDACAVVPAGPARKPSSLHAFVVWRDGEGVDELRAHLASRLPGHLVPAAITSLPELPLTRNGKIDRRMLTAEAAAGERAAASAAAAPDDPVSQVVSAVWSEVLDTDRIGVHDDFFKLGGNSLLANTIVTQLRDILGAELTLNELFAQPTVDAVSRRLTADPDRRDELTALCEQLSRHPLDHGEPTPTTQ